MLVQQAQRGEDIPDYRYPSKLSVEHLWVGGCYKGSLAQEQGGYLHQLTIHMAYAHGLAVPRGCCYFTQIQKFRTECSGFDMWRRGVEKMDKWWIDQIMIFGIYRFGAKCLARDDKNRVHQHHLRLTQITVIIDD